MPRALQSDDNIIASSADLAERVMAAGWLCSSLAEHRDPTTQIQQIARSLGEPLRGRKGGEIEHLAPTSEGSAEPQSLSALHGVSSFPIHTDGAHLVEPPRLIILACLNPGSSPVPTVIIRLRDLGIDGPARDRLEAGTYFVRNGRGSFYSSVYDPVRPFVRFDQGCMVPLDDNARRTTETIIDRAKSVGPTIFHWKKGAVLIVDNWQVLHGRGLAESSASHDRHIIRASVR